jgi:aryl-alcohol dehydrogenase-like predicted oxidoreductase
MVSPICIGAWQLGGPVTFHGKADGHPDPGEAKVLRLIETLHEEGINFIDTAEGYGGGESERRVGKALQKKRDQWVVSTKFGYRVGANQTRDDSSAPETILPSLEGSLRRLRTDYVDVYLYHCPPELEHLEAAKGILDAAKQSGKLRYYGISTNEVSLLEALYANEMLDVLQYDSSLIHPSDEVYQFAKRHGIGTQLRGVMANGRLSGKYFESQPQWSSDDNRSYYHAHRDFTCYAELAPLLPEGYTMSQCALRLLLDREGSHSVCLGAKNVDDYRSAIQAIGLPPVSAEVASRLWQKALELHERYDQS